MPCKHEGGTDPCNQSQGGQCRVYRAKWYAKNRRRLKPLKAAYSKRTKVFAKFKATKSDVGEAAELLVASDLLARGLNVTKPFNRNGADDLHFKAADGWKTVQVKKTAVHAITGTIYTKRTTGRGKVTSDVAAWVDLFGKRIRYESNTDEPLSKELT